MPNQLRIYLSGPITGNDNYLEQFAEAERLYTDLGYEVLNPTKLDDPNNPPPWAECIIRDLGFVLVSDIVALLPGWHTSHGARIEVMFAIKLGKRFAFMEGSVLGVTVHLGMSPDNLVEGDPEADFDEIDEKGFLEGGLDDIPGFDL